MIDFSLMSIDKIIIHSAPNSLRGVAPTFGSRVIHLEANALNELIQRITDVMGRGSNCVEMQLHDITNLSTVSRVISIMTDTTEENFISETRDLAQKLCQSQTNNRTPDGILVCLAGRTGVSQQQYLALIKAEEESGFHISSIEIVQFLSNLFLTKTQRLYKIGFFIRNNTNIPIIPENFSVYIFDQNATHTGTVGLANYFSNVFLGCKPMENNARLTELFYTTTKDFITKNPAFSEEQKLEITNSLHTYLKNDQSTVVSGQMFANAYFDNPEIIDQYTSLLARENFPLTAVGKDLSRIKTKLKIRRMKFNSGVRITFPSHTTDQEHNELLVFGNYDHDTDYTEVKIKGRIESQ